MSGLEFAFTYLFEPLGIGQDEVDWTAWRTDGQITCWAGLSLSARNMAKIGLLMANKGLWNGERIVSEEWVTNSTSKYKGTDFGYQWRLRQIAPGVKGFWAFGANNVVIYIIPEYDLAAVFTGFGGHWTIIWNYILPPLLPQATTTTSSITTTPTTSTSPTTHPEPPPPPELPMELILAVSGALVIVVALVVVFARRKS
jgi:hypothetical protein